MSKFNILWEYVQNTQMPSLTLTFEQIQCILGFPIDHSFLNNKKELITYGYEVTKISMKQKMVVFNKIAHK